MTQPQDLRTTYAALKGFRADELQPEDHTTRRRQGPQMNPYAQDWSNGLGHNTNGGSRGPSPSLYGALPYSNPRVPEFITFTFSPVDGTILNSLVIGPSIFRWTPNEGYIELYSTNVPNPHLFGRILQGESGVRLDLTSEAVHLGLLEVAITSAILLMSGRNIDLAERAGPRHIEARQSPLIAEVPERLPRAAS
ncbi:hypothetical protein B0H16DRAFT_1467058 [Mycena metata]|uniref:Uncharacterized protein n=1 Tax=Mycena metata TaxID=1033252 RepID=A0AAD7I6D9_9AGAR|nr:hypothetical protein B0H16DRAFT_1467058 [Mycena metata]